jgi:hypothetical protein
VLTLFYMLLDPRRPKRGVRRLSTPPQLRMRTRLQPRPRRRRRRRIPAKPPMTMVRRKKIAMLRARSYLRALRELSLA